jgi:hypothetical protein
MSSSGFLMCLCVWVRPLICSYELLSRTQIWPAARIPKLHDHLSVYDLYSHQGIHRSAFLPRSHPASVSKLAFISGTCIQLNRIELRPVCTHQLAACSFGLSVTGQQYFSLRTNQPPAISQQYFSLRTKQNQH